VVHVIEPDGKHFTIELGSDAEAGQQFQAVVKAGCWFGAEVAQNPHLWQNRPEVEHPPWALVGCTVSPGFEFEDFELGKRAELVTKYPQHRELIERLTRQ
jgi:predicted cupin superfamily sugar epimerase